jgi:ribosomal protein S9
MARPIRETPILFGKDAQRFTREMKRVENLSKDQRRVNREKLMQEAARIEQEWNLTFELERT